MPVWARVPLFLLKQLLLFCQHCKICVNNNMVCETARNSIRVRKKAPDDKIGDRSFSHIRADCHGRSSDKLLSALMERLTERFAECVSTPLVRPV